MKRLVKNGATRECCDRCEEVLEDGDADVCGPCLDRAAEETDLWRRVRLGPKPDTSSHGLYQPENDRQALAWCRRWNRSDGELQKIWSVTVEFADGDVEVTLRDGAYPLGHAYADTFLVAVCGCIRAAAEDTGVEYGAVEAKKVATDESV